MPPKIDKAGQFIKFEVLSLDCIHVQGFQNSEKLETLYGFGGRHLRIKDICMEIGRLKTGRTLVTTQKDTTQLGKLIFMRFLAMGFFSS